MPFKFKFKLSPDRYTEAELQAAKEAMEAVMEQDADAVDEVVGALRAELQVMDAEYNGLLESMRETQRRGAVHSHAAPHVFALNLRA